LRAPPSPPRARMELAVREPSYKARRLARMLNEALKAYYGSDEYTVDPNEIYLATGFYRTSKYADVQRWWAVVRWKPFLGGSNGALGNIGSWDTMTDCIKFGIELRRDRNRAHDFDAMSKNPINYPPSQRAALAATRKEDSDG